MPQLSPLPWLIFMIVSFVPIFYMAMVSESVCKDIGGDNQKYMLLVMLKW